MRYNRLFELLWIWASYLLLSINCQTCSINYPDYRGQWYLKNRGHCYDMNVLPAWRHCINGTGVAVGVVGTGVQDHFDLNIDRSLDGRYALNVRPTNIRMYSRLSGSHYRYGFGIDDEILRNGTRAAGIIAARRNRIGITGIAFGAKIADIRIASTRVFDTFNAASLYHRSDVIDVYSWSLSSFHTESGTYPLLESQEHALQIGTTQGRHGLGSVYVFGTENICAYDRLVSNRYVISVTGIQQNLRQLPNREACSSVMVAALTSSPGLQYKVETTDIENSFILDFDQNAVAVSMVSGAVALALSANPNLGNRDVMHLLAQTSRSNLTHSIHGYYTTNAAGFNVSSYFGFGLLDIGALVHRSKSWRNVPNVQQCTKMANFDATIQSTGNNFVIHVSFCDVTYIEHVEVTLKVQHQYSGQIKWVLISPYGTRSTILPGRRSDHTISMDITALTVSMWGENPNGYWRLEPTAVFGKSITPQFTNPGTLDSVKLNIYGHRCQAIQCLPPALQEGSWGSWTTWSPCSVSCGQGTTHRSRDCRGCINGICYGQSWEGRLCNSVECPVYGESVTTDMCPSQTNLLTICAEQCSTDRDCWGRSKCCYNGCGHTCEQPITRMRNGACPSPNIVQSYCAEKCSSDSECLGDTICCFNGCGHTCEQPSTDSWNSWSPWTHCSVTCGEGTQSISRQCRRNMFCSGDNSEKRPCYTAECPTCRQQVGIQSSTCPSHKTLVSVCAERCSSDRECEGHMKCCFNGCGHTCHMTTTVSIKSGTCPSVRNRRLRCAEECSTDSDCWGSRKCCFNGCGRTCEMPTRRSMECSNVTTTQAQERDSVKVTLTQSQGRSESTIITTTTTTRVRETVTVTSTETQGNYDSSVITTQAQGREDTIVVTTEAQGTEHIMDTSTQPPERETSTMVVTASATQARESSTITPTTQTQERETSTMVVPASATQGRESSTITPSTQTQERESSTITPTTQTQGRVNSIATSTQAQVLTSSQDQFECHNGARIDIELRCNDEFDCDDLSDELDCGTSQACPEGQFRCNDGECVGPTSRCDGQSQCVDNSDEVGCQLSTRSTLQTYDDQLH